MTAHSESGACRPRIFFSAILHPHRSLSAAGFTILMAAVGMVGLALGTLFLIIGAWPVFGFLGLDVLLLWLAFRHNYREARMYEAVCLTEQDLTVQRVEPRKPVRVWRFQPYWLRVSMDDPPRHDSQVVLSSHGRSVSVGSFLTPEERLEFATALRCALARLYRQPPAMMDAPI